MNKEIMISVLAVVPLMFVSAPATASNSCGSTGFGDESCNTVGTCSSNAYISVSASVDESNWVNGYVGCAGTSTTCSGSLNCYNSAGPTSQSGNGNCGGSGNGGWWTVLSVGCGGMLEESSPVQKAVNAILRAQVSPTLTLELEKLLTPDEGNRVWILGSRGVIVGYSCEAGAGCAVTPVVCNLGLAAWSCDAKWT